jgi:hypothetical protein
MSTKRPCALCCRDDADSDGIDGRARVAWIQCPDCGWYALTERADEEIAKLPPESPGRVNLISYTLSVQTKPVGQLIPLLWKCAFQGIDQPTGLPKDVRNIEDFISAPVVREHLAAPGLSKRRGPC